MTTSTLLLDTARRGELHHSIILAGPVPDQLRQLATSIARALNCLNQTSGDACVSCQKIERGTHPDVHVISVADDRKLISVEQIRNLVNAATMRPYEGRFKVFIVDPAEALSDSGENALLKTLEEPTRDTVFLLLARTADLLLPTIRSRSQSIFIAPQSDPGGEVAISIQAARLRQLALWPGAQPDATETMARSVLEGLAEAAGGNTAALLRVASILAVEQDGNSSLALLIAILRDLASLSPADSIDPEQFRKAQEGFSRRQFLDAASLALRAMTRLEVNADVRLMIEQAFLPLAKHQNS